MSGFCFRRSLFSRLLQKIRAVVAKEQGLGDPLRNEPPPDSNFTALSLSEIIVTKCAVVKTPGHVPSTSTPFNGSAALPPSRRIRLKFTLAARLGVVKGLGLAMTKLKVFVAPGVSPSLLGRFIVRWVVGQLAFV